MNKYSNVNEKEFLLGYIKFTSKIRPRVINDLCNHYRESDDFDTKAYWHILAMEQLFLLYEGFEGVFRACIDRKKAPFLDTMTKGQSVTVIEALFNSKTKAEIFTLLKGSAIKYSNVEVERQIDSRISAIIDFWTSKDIIKMFKAFIPLFNAMKHKLMLYKKEGRVIFVLENIKEKYAETAYAELGLKKADNLPENIDWISETARYLESFINDLITLRLYELGVNLGSIEE